MCSHYPGTPRDDLNCAQPLPRHLHRDDLNCVQPLPRHLHETTSIVCSHCPGTSTHHQEKQEAALKGSSTLRRALQTAAASAEHCRQPPHLQGTADSRRICRAPQTAAASAGHRRQPLHQQGTADSRRISRALQTAAASACARSTGSPVLDQHMHVVPDAAVASAWACLHSNLLLASSCMLCRVLQFGWLQS